MHASLESIVSHWPDDLTRQRHWILRGYLCIALLTVGSFSFLHGPFNQVPSSLACMAALAVIGLMYLWRQWPIAATTHALLGVCFCFLYFISWHTGGLASPQLLWLGILPLPCLMLMGYKETLFWVAVVMSAIGSLFGFTLSGTLPSDLTFSAQHIDWALISLICIAINVFWVPLFYFAQNKKQLINLKERNLELEKNRLALLQSEAYKDEFVAAVGHELRTPMNAILGFNDVLLTDMQLAPKELEVVRLIRQSTDKLLKLVNQILDYSQLQAGRLVLNPAPVQISSALAQCQDSFQTPPSSPVQFVTALDPDIPAWVMLDALRVKEVLCHLIDNAFKFTSQGEVRLRVTRQQDALQFEVIDSGSGIPAELQEHIFKRFEHADQATLRQFGGTGLGLAISKQLVSLFGGTMGLESTLGKGSRFWFRMPLQACEAPDVPASPTDAPDLGNMAIRLLLVDDNPINLQVARFMCQSIWPQAHITDANSGAQCLALLAQSPFDVVLMDMFMPGMSGPQTCQSIRQQPAPVCHIPIIGLTASTHAQDRATCLDAGMNEVLSKPMDKHQLVTAVQKQLRRSMAEKGNHVG